MRRYDYSADDIPFNRFNDLQPFTEAVDLSNKSAKITIKPQSVIFLTTDYEERTPSKIKNIVIKNNMLSWDESADNEHCYYRVFASDSKDFVPGYENQIASTVATRLQIENNKLFYKVLSVDKYGNI